MNHRSLLQASASFTPTEVSHVPKPTVGEHCKVMWHKVWMWSPITKEWRTERKISVFVWLLRHLTHGFLPALLDIPSKFLLWILLSPNIQHWRFQGSFLCILLHLLVFSCSSPCRLLAGNTEDTPFQSLASSKLQMHMPSWMLNKYLKLSMFLLKLPIISLFQWLKNLPTSQSFRPTTSESSLSLLFHILILSLGNSNWFYV